MELAYVFACGIVWRYTGDREAGWELIRALGDEDGDVHDLATTILADRCQDPVALLNAAIAARAVDGRDAAEVLAAMTANQYREHSSAMARQEQFEREQS